MTAKIRGAARVPMSKGYKNAGARKMRRPQHPFQIDSRPYAITPFFIAPVLPGETMKTLLWQSRVVTDPIANPLVGWWQEYFFFYVKLTDLDERDTVIDMMTKNSGGPAALGAASIPNYGFNGGVDWVGKCLKRVVEEYFRNEGETWNGFMIGSYPAAQLNSMNWLNSFTAEQNIVDDAPEIVVGGDDKITAQEIQEAMDTWALLKDMNLTDMTYEDYLRTFGVNTEPEVQFKPELVRYSRHWTYPSNSVNPADGSVASACSWSINERADKNRYFREPGFLFGVSLTRAKVYMKNLPGSLTGAMNSATAWMPAALHDRPETSIAQFAELSGPVPNFNTADNLGYWVDIRDLLVYGEQFVNFDMGTETGKNLVAFPDATGQWRYIDGTAVDALFKGTAKEIRQDGLVSLHIAGRQEDTTPGVPSINV